MRWSLRHCYKILRWPLVREYLEALYTLYWRPREGELWLQKYMTVEGWSGFHNPILIHPHIWDHSMRSRTFAIRRSVKAYQQWWQSPNKESTLPNMANMVHCKQTTWTTLLISNVSCHVLGSFPLMSTPTMALPSSPLYIEGACKPLHTSLTNYSPPALWHWVHSQDLQPTKSTIDAEWHKRHLDIYKDNLSYTSPTTFLHPHFCLNSVDRSLTYHEGISDIWDAVSTYIHHTSSLADFCLQGCCNGLPTSYISSLHLAWVGSISASTLVQHSHWDHCTKAVCTASWLACCHREDCQHCVARACSAPCHAIPWQAQPDHPS